MDYPLIRHLPIISKRLEFKRASREPMILPLPKISQRLRLRDMIAQHEAESASGINPIQQDSADLDDSMEPISGEEPPHSEVEDEDQDQDESEDDDLESEEGNEPLRPLVPIISKPPGEPGRPGSGGYALPKVLTGWTSTFYKQVNDFVKEEGQKRLNTSISFKGQDPGKIADICTTTVLKFPMIKKYDNYWPIRDMLKLYLKYESEKSRGGGKKKKLSRRTN